MISSNSSSSSYIIIITFIIIYTRKLLGWLETRLAQNTLDYIEIVLITLKIKKTPSTLTEFKVIITINIIINIIIIM